MEILPASPYPEYYDAVVNQAKRELQAGYRPPLRTAVDNIGAYDVILVGSPNWWNTVAPPVMDVSGGIRICLTKPLPRLSPTKGPAWDVAPATSPNSALGQPCWRGWPCGEGE